MRQSRDADISNLRIDESVRNRGNGRGKWYILAAGAAVVLSALGLLSLSKDRAVNVEVAIAKTSASKGNSAVLNASGYVTPRRRATVAAKITGRVKEMLVDEGMKVEEGQLLATLDDREARKLLEASDAELALARASIAELEVNLIEAEKNLKRTGELNKAGIASAQELDRARAEVDSLKAKINVAKEEVKASGARRAVAYEEIENCSVKAPFQGIVVSKDAQPGEIVSPISAGGGYTRTGIATIVDMNSLEIEVDVNESFIARVTPGQRVEATLDAYPDWHIPAKVRTVIPSADRQKATVKVRISFDALDPRLLPDMGVKVAFLENLERNGGKTADTILVPKEAVLGNEGKQVVFVLKEERIERRAVKAGQIRGGEMELIAGVSAGEKVIVKGDGELKDGRRAKERIE